MIIFTIGFAQKSAEKFFQILKENNVECLIDVRLNNVSQLAGFTKSKDLQYFLKTIVDADYIHNIKYAPTKDILDDYKKNKISWLEYEIKYRKLIESRKIEQIFKNDIKNYNNVCLLCSEPLPQNCHRRLLAEYLKKQFNKVEVKHL
mgnify:CR=1 FL=1